MINVAEKLAETDLAIEELRKNGASVPEEALEMREIFHRCVTAERQVEVGIEAEMNLGKLAYEAYADHTGFKSLATGADLPQWVDLKLEIRTAWTVAAACVAGVVLRKLGVI